MMIKGENNTKASTRAFAQKMLKKQQLITLPLVSKALREGAWFCVPVWMPDFIFKFNHLNICKDLPFNIFHAHFFTKQEI